MLRVLSRLCLLAVALACTRATRAQVTVSIDVDSAFQTIEGFGTSIINYKDFPPEYDDPDFVDRVVNDLGLSILRLPMMEHMEHRNDDDDPDHFNWLAFSLAPNVRRRGFARTMAFAQRFQRAGVERFIMSPWSPPQFMKTNAAPIQGGFLRYDMTAELAEYLAANVILAKHNYGIDVGWVSLQNESIFVEFYRSCLYHPAMMREAVRAAMRKFEREGIRTQLLLNEDMLFAERIIHGVGPTLDDHETGRFDGHVAVHRKQGEEGLTALREWLEPYGRALWMTETSGHDADWRGAFRMANDMHEYLAYGNVGAWLYWQISGETGSSDPGRYTLMSGGQPTKKYHAAKHYYRYVRPGARRVAAEVPAGEDSVRVTAYVHPVTGQFTAVLINRGGRERSVELAEARGRLPFAVQRYLTTEALDCTPVPLSGKPNTVALPPRSIVTLVGYHPALATAEPTERPASVDLAALDLDAGSGGERGLLGDTSAFPARVEWQRAADGGGALLAEARAKLAAGDIDEARFNGWTILHDAALNGDLAALRFALDHGADVDAVADDGWTPLHAAAAGFVGSPRHGGSEHAHTKYDVFAAVLAAGPALDARTDEGFTALHVAAMNAYTGWRQDQEDALGKVRDLIAAGVPVDAADALGRTALHWAAAQGYAHFRDNKLQVDGAVAAALLAGGADPDLRDDAGLRPIDYARQMGYTTIVAVLAGEAPDAAPTNEPAAALGNYGPQLLKAAWRGDRAEVARLLALGADADYIDSDGFTALERARDNGHAAIVALIENHAHDNH